MLVGGVIVMFGPTSMHHRLVRRLESVTVSSSVHVIDVFLFASLLVIVPHMIFSAFSRLLKEDRKRSCVATDSCISHFLFFFPKLKILRTYHHIPSVGR